MINEKYVLFIEIPLLKHPNGKLYCCPFWAKDLKYHFDHIANLSLCCPVIEINDDSDMADLKNKISYGFGELEDISSFDIKELISLHFCQGWFSTLKYFIPNFLIVKNTLKPDCIAHSGGTGWPFPISFYLLVLHFFYRFKWIMIIESTFFKITKNEKFTLRRFMAHHIYSFLLPLCCKYADARIFTHNHYKNMFLKDSERVHVAAISSLDAEFLIDEVSVHKKFKDLNERKLRFIFVGKLIKDKGVLVLLEAINILNRKNVSAQIDIMGNGDLETTCREFVKAQNGSISMSFVETISYGVDFFKHLASYDVLLSPNLQDEQSRIIYDAFGQGLMIIGSDAEGLKESCRNEVNALLTERGNFSALASAIEFATKNPSKVLEMGLNGLSFARSKTHQQMHQDRYAFIQKVLS
jgi:glycosyltransferase involved in cell wall biosynthesis